MKLIPLILLVLGSTAQAAQICGKVENRGGDLYLHNNFRNYIWLTGKTVTVFENEPDLVQCFVGDFVPGRSAFYIYYKSN
jgi:hypothetical protein